MTLDEELKAIKEVIATFPATFGLRAFPGDRFRIGERQSYFGGAGNNTMMLYTQRLKTTQVKNGPSKGQYQDEWVDFAKGTPEELRRQVVKL